MLFVNYILTFIILITLLILYQKYQTKQKIQDLNTDTDLKKYLLSESSLTKSKKPILWIYVPHEYNSRNWTSFGSRSSFEVNQPYLYLTLKSIIKNCDNSFKIYLIDDASFKKLIPNWDINLLNIGEPTLSYIRQMAMAKLIYIYGGVSVPLSFLCFRDLIDLYKKGTRGNKMFVCENTNSNITSSSNLYYPDASFMGANKQNNMVKEYINFMERTISHDFTAQITFLGDFNRWCNKKVNNQMLNLITATDMGVKTILDEPVTIERLLGQDYIDFYKNMYGIWIPADIILKRTHYEWFSRMSAEQIFQSKFILAKYFVLSLAPDSKHGVIAPLEGKPDWISFWRTPKINIWGLMPQNLGNKVQRELYPNY